MNQGIRLSRVMIYLIGMIAISCEQFVSIDPPRTQIVSEAVFQDDQSALSAIKGIYSAMISTTGFADGGGSSLCVLTGMSADELISYSTSPDYNGFYTNTLTAGNTVLQGNLWALGYKYIFYANTILEGLQNSKGGLSQPTVAQLEGEAKFVRAFCHFYLVNLFGDVPLVTSPDYRVNKDASRIKEGSVYDQIISDLKDAQRLLPSDYSVSTGERIRPNTWAATAMLARVYLYQKNWAEAESEATKIISNTGLFQLSTDLNQVFLKNSSEAIWQLKPVDPGLNTREGNLFILKSIPNNVSLTNDFITSFESNDNRFTNWVGSYNSGATVYYYPYKYKIFTGNAPFNEYSMVLRLAEQYLIRAEARAQSGNLAGAVADTDVIRSRAGLPLISTIEPGVSKNELLLSIEQERKVELFTEWGHRWLDLKRTDRATPVLSLIKNDWQPDDALYAIPQVEINNDPNLNPQNPGY
ncbi:MAG: RagB/SusD family nutrient uptake outer membrane protein [Bacteroidota bacterium]